jgi:hypothetical protein
MVYAQDHKEIIERLAALFPRLRRPLKKNIVLDIEKQGCSNLIGVDVGAAVGF